MTFGNGLQETRDYYANGRLQCQQLGDQPPRCYQYDANGNLINRNEATTSADYGYDPWTVWRRKPVQTTAWTMAMTATATA